MEKTRERLCADGGKPAGMHRATYLRITRSYAEAVACLEALREERLARLAASKAARRARWLKRKMQRERFGEK